MDQHASVLNRLLGRTFHHLGSHSVCEGGCFPSSLCFLNELDMSILRILRYLNVWVLTCIHEPGIRHEMVRAIQWYRCSVKCSIIITEKAFLSVNSARMLYVEA
mgnify:CR=1 FL=1